LKIHFPARILQWDGEADVGQMIAMLVPMTGVEQMIAMLVVVRRTNDRDVDVRTSNK
uniref:Transposase n=1 Tax=Gongylonema pulchrum TaxID=637853 RepID=A0A183EUA4_9BILA